MELKGCIKTYKNKKRVLVNGDMNARVEDSKLGGVIGK